MVQLKLGLEHIRSYKRLAYTAWHAFAEFVDNSTQSFFDNRAALEAAYDVEDDLLTVSIVLDRDSDLIRIADNAMGMSYAELERALHVGMPPENPTGRSRYGMGMKTAACWFGDRWTVTTKKLGETVEHRVVVDVEQIASGSPDVNYSSREGLSPDLHYTIVEIHGGCPACC